MHDRRIPAFLNPNSGSADRARDALRDAGAYVVSETDAETLDRELRRAAAEGVQRVVVAGGDGTIASAAAALAGSATSLAIVPGGTLNHFARDHGLPTDHTEAACVGVDGVVSAVDVGYVNDRLFLNTSSVGAYVLFVRTRERLEKWLGYRIATVLAALRLLGRVRPFTVELVLDDVKRRYRSALVFVAVGERELQLPALGARVDGGRRALHVIVVRGGTWARLVAVGVTAAFRGTRALARGTLVDSFVVDRCRVELRRPKGGVALDGELATLASPLEYRIGRDALKIVVPAPDVE